MLQSSNKFTGGQYVTHLSRDCAGTVTMPCFNLQCLPGGAAFLAAPIPWQNKEIEQPLIKPRQL
jgi:hypothetical protein